MAVSDIFREVDEELRRERAIKLWRKYGRHVIAVALIIVLGTGGYQAWKAYQEQRQVERAEAFAAAMSQAAAGETEAALQDLAALTADGVGGYGTLAAFERARLLAEQGDESAAIELWDRLAESSDVAPAIRPVATLFSVMHQLDDGDAAALEARLAPLSEPGSAFRPSALELSALLALRQGNRDQARQLYSEIADDLTAPAGLRARAAQMLAALEP